MTIHVELQNMSEEDAFRLINENREKVHYVSSDNGREERERETPPRRGYAPYTGMAYVDPGASPGEERIEPIRGYGFGTYGYGHRAYFYDDNPVLIVEPDDNNRRTIAIALIAIVILFLTAGFITLIVVLVLRPPG